MGLRLLTSACARIYHHPTHSVAQSEGVPGLYAGLSFRVLYSALFTSVGFASFEATKMLLGVHDDAQEKNSNKNKDQKKSQTSSSSASAKR